MQQFDCEPCPITKLWDDVGPDQVHGPTLHHYSGFARLTISHGAQFPNQIDTPSRSNGSSRRQRLYQGNPQIRGGPCLVENTQLDTLSRWIENSF
jgi:hypothetical protein